LLSPGILFVLVATVRAAQGLFPAPAFEIFLDLDRRKNRLARYNTIDN